MLLSRRVRLAACCLVWFLWSALAFSAGAAPLIILDPGHNPDDGGATSVQGTKEVVYNDRFVGELAPALRHAGWQVVVTRAPGARIGLIERAELANRLHATVFLSVHHDSALRRYLMKVEREGRTVYQTLKPLEGYSLYVSGENPDFAQSYRLATLLGEQLRQLGRPPALHHAEKAPGENRPLLDKFLGIYRYDALAVLRHSKMPAVLLEVGVITDLRDEAYVDDPGNREKMIVKIVRALQQYRREAGAP
ncbi:N-acetylmuramoyl-L-alanine amidase OS=Castellaniella defragrans OX=75697 GN=HNR28_002633 PE=4 SV=1 [Castellaniella defragrans]